ncbi:MAG TPA: hypothetical protein VFV39_05565 [Limnobacter sp.]|nr:hypothetical protein [Limnobacter sp.]
MQRFDHRPAWTIITIHAVDRMVHVVVPHVLMPEVAVTHGLVMPGRLHARCTALKVAGKHADLRHALDGQGKHHETHADKSDELFHRQQHSSYMKTLQVGEND